MTDEKQLFQLVADKDFLLLDSHLTKFTPFDVLKLKNHEIRHSNMLAWLLNPEESHGLGFSFLEQFVLALAESQDSVTSFLTKLHSSTAKPYVTVRREAESKEKRRVDLLVKCTLAAENNMNKGNSFVILIENKIYSRQRKDQLKDYLEHAKKQNPNSTIIPVYLTLDEEDEPSEPDYCHLTHKQILEIVRKLVKKERSCKAERAALSFLEYYLAALEELTGMDTENQELARGIYRKYKKVIEYINQNAESDIAIAGRLFIENYNKGKGHEQLIELKHSRSKFFPFTDGKLRQTEGGLSDDWREGNICGYFFEWKNSDSDSYEGNISLKVEIGPFENETQRNEFLDLLKSKGFKTRTRKTNTYTRLSYEKQPPRAKNIEDASDEEELLKAMTSLFDGTKEMRKALHKCLDSYKTKKEHKDEN